MNVCSQGLCQQKHQLPANHFKHSIFHSMVYETVRATADGSKHQQNEEELHFV